MVGGVDRKTEEKGRARLVVATTSIAPLSPVQAPLVGGVDTSSIVWTVLAVRPTSLVTAVLWSRPKDMASAPATAPVSTACCICRFQRYHWTVSTLIPAAPTSAVIPAPAISSRLPVVSFFRRCRNVPIRLPIALPLGLNFSENGNYPSLAKRKSQTAVNRY